MKKLPQISNLVIQKFSNSPLSNSPPGFTLIEVLLDALVIGLIFGAVIGSFLFILNATNSGRVRTLAGSLANEQMEYLRNLPYDALATQNGTVLPQGNIPDNQTITRGGIGFTLTTTIIFVDDLLDGCAIPNGNNTYQCTDGTISNTFDFVPVDYKRINVSAFKAGTPNILTQLSSNAAAKAAETPGNTGMLLIKISDAHGLPVPQARVTITNPSTLVSIDALTNEQGYIFVANLPPDSHNGYHIVASKEGYSSDYTTPRTPQNPNQVQPDVDISVQQVTTQSLQIDQLSNMVVTVTNEVGAVVPGVAITATSDKIITNNPDTPKNIYTQTTSGSGIATFTDIEWDSYTLTAAGSYIVLTTSPYQAVTVNPAADLAVSLVITTDNSWPGITSVAPTSGPIGSTIDITITGFNFNGATTVVLHHPSGINIIPTNTDVSPNQKSITITVNLAGAAPGDWDIIVNSNGKVVTELEGLTVS